MRAQQCVEVGRFREAGCAFERALIGRHLQRKNEGPGVAPAPLGGPAGSVLLRRVPQRRLSCRREPVIQIRIAAKHIAQRLSQQRAVRPIDRNSRRQTAPEDTRVGARNENIVLLQIERVELRAVRRIRSYVAGNCLLLISAEVRAQQIVQIQRGRQSVVSRSGVTFCASSRMMSIVSR